MNKEDSPNVSHCPVSGLESLQFPEWKKLGCSESYQTEMSLLGSAILLSLPQGRAQLGDLVDSLELLKKIVTEQIGEGQPLVLLVDNSKMTGISIEARKYYAKALRDVPGLIGWVMFGSNWSLKTAAKLTRSVLNFPFPILVVADYKQAIEKALELLKTKGIVFSEEGLSLAGSEPVHLGDEPKGLILQVLPERKLKITPQIGMGITEVIEKIASHLEDRAEGPFQELWDLSQSDLTATDLRKNAGRPWRTRGVLVFPCGPVNRSLLAWGRGLGKHHHRTYGFSRPEAAFASSDNILALQDSGIELLNRVSKDHWKFSGRDFEVRYERLGEDIFYADSKGYLDANVVESLFNAQRKIFKETGLAGKPYYIIGGVRELSGSSAKARQLYKQQLLDWNKDYPFEFYLLFGVDSFLRTAINLARPLVPFAAYVARDFDEALQRAEENRQKGRQIPEDNPLVTTLLQRLGTINWDVDETTSLLTLPQKQDQEFEEVFASIDLIREEVRDLLFEKDQSA